MFRRLFANWSTTARIAMGQAGILLTLLLVASYLEIIPDENAAIMEGRAAVGEVAALNSSIFITRADLQRMEASLRLLVTRHDDLLSAAVIASSGRRVATIGDHPQHGNAEQVTSTPGQITVPMWEGEREWGRIELRFTPLLPAGWQRYVAHPLVQLVVFLTGFCFLIYYVYLNRMLKMLDPSQAVPDRVRSALDTMAEGLLVLDKKQNIVLANSAFSDLVEVPASKLIGWRVADFDWDYPSEYAFDKANTPWGKALETCTAQIGKTVRLHHSDGRELTFKTNSSPVMASADSISGVLVSFDDVSELKQKEIELRNSKEEAETANRAKSDFLANMSHEIRTPMNAIMGFTEVLLRGYGKNEDSQRKHLQTISRSSSHLLGLINDVLDLSKVEAGHMEVELIPCAVHTIIKDVVDILQVKAREKGIYLRFEPSGPLPAQFSSDPAKLRQIMTNLVGNAVKFTDQGGITVVTRLLGQTESSALEIDVIDTGIGMAPDQVGKVFEAFSQADSSITRRFGGTGLGLTISKRFALALGGDIEVGSVQGQGSTFTTRISVGDLTEAAWLNVEQLTADDAADEVATGRHWVFPTSRVLVVDDAAENRELLELLLEDHGLGHSMACNGQEALDRVMAETFDIVLMDVQMPVMDGYTAVGLMRERGLQLPIVALTAEALNGEEQKCLAAGYSDYLSKPIDIDRLLNLMARKLGAEQRLAPVVAGVEDEQHSSAVAEAPVPAQAQPQAIRSLLPMDKPRYRRIVEKFTVRLAEQIVAMQMAAQNDQLEELALLGHWLKGSAGSVGLHEFTEPAKVLEHLARTSQRDEIPRLVATLDEMQKRIVLDDELPVQLEQPPTISSQAAIASMPDVIVSRLANGRPKFQNLIEKFVARLAERYQEMESAVQREDFDELAGLAHWLKGSAGSVGFDTFTQPALELETQARERQLAGVRRALEVIDEMQKRIVLSSIETADV